MDTIKYDWKEIEKISNAIWEDDIDLINEGQLAIIEQSIDENKELKEFFIETKSGSHLEFFLVLDNVKTILELVLCIWAIVSLVKNKDDDNEILLQVKQSKKNKKVETKMKEMDEETLKKVIGLIKANYKLNN
jgi:hypothetical protein